MDDAVHRFVRLSIRLLICRQHVVVVHQFGTFYSHLSPAASCRLLVNTTQFAVLVTDSQSLLCTWSVQFSSLLHAMPRSCLKLFGHVARADKSQDHSRALQACISAAPKNWRRRPGRPRHTWLRTVEEDLRQFNLGLASGLRRAQNRTAWRALTGTATSPTSSD